MKFWRIGIGVWLTALVFLSVLRAQDTASLTGTVHDASGAVVAGASVTLSNGTIGLSRQTVTNGDGDYLVSGLPAGPVDLAITAKGFKKFEAKGVILRVTQKVRLDAPLELGDVTTAVVVQGDSVAQVDTQSSEIAGTITATELSQLELNGRNFTQLITLTPGVSNQTGQDEGTVGVYGSVEYSVNGGRAEYNNWEIDGGDTMDNGSNQTLNVYPSIDAIAEVRVLTSNYGAQYGRNASGTVEAETKSGTSSFHGDVYEFNRNEIFNAKSFSDPSRQEYKKNDFGYTLGGPIYIPGHYNADKTKTFFFWSEEWRLERVPNGLPPTDVPSVAERTGNFNDVCPDLTGSYQDCPTLPGTGSVAGGGTQYPGNIVPVDPNGTAILPLIPAPNNPAGTNACNSTIGACYISTFATPVSWREELFRIDHNINPHLRASFRYIHDSWSTVTPSTLWTGANFPTVKTNFAGPGVSMVAHLEATASPTLMNEFVASYTTDHVDLNNTGSYQRPSGMTMGGLFNNGFNNSLPAISLAGNTAYTFFEDPSYEPWKNSNPTYTFRDNVTKIIGKHNLQFGVYIVAAQKNQPSSLDTEGSLTFDASNSTVSSGNSFADLLGGNISSFQQANRNLKYYDRYQVAEPYIQDDFHVSSRLTLNLGLRWSLFGTYHEKYNQEYNWEAAVYNRANAPGVDPDGSITGTADELYNPVTLAPLSFNSPQVFNGIVQCGGTGIPRGCEKGQLINPAPRLGFAWDPQGNGKSSIRGGYGIFFEHGNGDEANSESLQGSPPGVLNPAQSNITGASCGAASGYECIGGGAGGAPPAFPLAVTSIPTKAVWPYAQQWNLDFQRELIKDTIASVAYVGSKGTHLDLQRDLNQLQPIPASLNPYAKGQPLTSDDCSSGLVNGTNPITSYAQVVQNAFNVACGNIIADPLRPYYGFGDITSLENVANSAYHSMQVSVRRTVAPLTVGVAYTYSYSLDDSSDRYDATFVNSYNFKSNWASSNFDQRHVLNFSYVYDFPNFKEPGLKRTLLGGWEFSGITSFQTGTPFSVTYGVFGDNAGVANGVVAASLTGSYADVVGNPKSAPPAGSQGAAYGPLLFNPAAFAAPQGLTFGDAGRNSLRYPTHTNFDMALFKHFQIRESTRIEVRAEAFNVFNHTQFEGGLNTVGIDSNLTCANPPTYSEGDPSCLSDGFLRPTVAHLGRIIQLGAKILF